MSIVASAYWTHGVRAAVLSILLGLLAGCAASAQEVYDPIEPVNRVIFRVNDTVDRAVFEPVAKVYRAVTPDQFRRSVRNFLFNLRSPVIFANDVLQGERDRAGITLGRFMINSTLGIGGLFDAAAAFGYPPHDQDFGQTLGKYGMRPGAYLVLPLLGPSNVRDTFGRVGDYFFDPLNQCCIDTDERLERFGASALSDREQVIDVIDDLRRNSLDMYATVRSAYAQRRAAQIREGQPVQGEAYDDIFKDPEGNDVK